MAIYLDLEGVKGNVTAAGYEGHIALRSMKFGVRRGISMEPGNLSNREATLPVIHQITVSKAADLSVTALFKQSVTGATGRKAVIRFVHTGTDGVRQYMDYSLENCMISGYWINAGSQDGPVETIALSFSRITVNVGDHDAANRSSSPQRVGYDLTTAKAL